MPGPAGAISAGVRLPCLCPQPDLVERLISVDISPISTTPVSEFSAYVSAMKSVKIPDGLSRSAARQLADDQLRPVVQVGNPTPWTELPLPACAWDRSTGLRGHETLSTPAHLPLSWAAGGHLTRAAEVMAWETGRRGSREDGGCQDIVRACCSY